MLVSRHKYHVWSKKPTQCMRLILICLQRSVSHFVTVEACLPDTLQLYQSGLQTWCRTLHTKERGYFWIWCTRFCDYRVRPYWYLDTRIKPQLHFGLGILFDPCQKIGLISSWACQPLKLIVNTSMCVVQFLPTQGDTMASNTVYCCTLIELWWPFVAWCVGKHKLLLAHSYANWNQPYDNNTSM